MCGTTAGTAAGTAGAVVGAADTTVGAGVLAPVLPPVRSSPARLLRHTTMVAVLTTRAPTTTLQEPATTLSRTTTVWLSACNGTGHTIREVGRSLATMDIAIRARERVAAAA